MLLDCLYVCLCSSFFSIDDGQLFERSRFLIWKFIIIKYNEE